MSINSQNKLIQKEFTKQAHAYATNPTISDPDWALRLVESAQPAPQDHVLEIATGPGYVAMAFARFAGEVVGIDLTDAPLALAEATRQERGLENVRFQTGDANQLAFADHTFDAVVCRLAFHHFAAPKQVLSEMVRVCRPGGKIAVEDLVASEHQQRADYHNHWERLRDPSHVTALSITELLQLFTAEDLETIQIQTENRPQVVEQWMNNSQTPDDIASEIRQLLAEDEKKDLSGMRLFHNEAGQLCFDHRMTTLVGVRL